TRSKRDWSSDVCSSDLPVFVIPAVRDPSTVWRAARCAAGGRQCAPTERVRVGCSAECIDVNEQRVARETANTHAPSPAASPAVYGDELAIVVVTYSPGRTLARMLDTLDTATERRVRVIIADNGSTDGVPEQCAERPDVQLVYTGANLGYGGGVNRGIAELSTEFGWVVIANADLEWTLGALDELLAAAQRRPRG